MFLMEISGLQVEIEIDLSEMKDEEHFRNGWAVLHLDANDIVKGLHYTEDDNEGKDYLNYIAEYDIAEDDKIYYGRITEHTLFCA